jgi:type VI secretion system protein ImpH
MAATGGRKSPPLTQQLFDQPCRFDFFQAVRLLELLSRRDASFGKAARQSVGFDLPPKAEPVRFRAHASLAFPPSAIVELQPDENGVPAEHGQNRPPQMTVSFMGLTGPQGVLPDHYTRLLMDRIRDGDHAMREFFDLFNHRFVSLAYRAWAKYRLFVQYERANRAATDAEPDAVTHGLFCLVGMGTRYLRRRLAIDDETLLYYGGHMALTRPVATSLELTLREYFGTPLELQQFCGHWLALSVEEQSRLTSTLRPADGYCQLGTSAWVGRRVWDVQSKFRIRLGPLDYGQFQRFLPNGRSFAALCQFVRFYVGPEFDFDVQLVLLANEVPRCRVGGTAVDGNRLGWNTWLCSRAMDHNVDSAIFSCDHGSPTQYRTEPFAGMPSRNHLQPAAHS